MDPEAVVLIEEVITVDPETGNAVCFRSYTLNNAGPSPMAFPSPLRVGLDVRANVVAARLNEKNFLDQTDIDVGSYELTLRLLGEPPIVEPGSSMKFEIEYEWPELIPKAIEPTYRRSIRIRHPFNFLYELSLRCEDKQFLANPAFKISPEACRPAAPFLVRESDGQAYRLRTALVVPNTLLAITISGGHGNITLPVLIQLGDMFAAQAPFKDVAVVFIQHLLTDFEATIDAFVRSGLDPGNAFIMGIPYSTKENVHTRLQSTFGYVPPQFENYPFDTRLAPILDQVYEHCKTKGQRFLVVEDGGYIAGQFRRHASGPKWASLCIGIVEQTRNGIWVTQDWISNPADTDNPLNVAVVNVAETKLKLDLESPLIGQAVVFNLKRLLALYEEQTLSDRKVVLIGGCGSTGSRILSELVREGCVVTVIDERPRPADFPGVATYRPATELIQTLAGKDIVIGSTGKAMGSPTRDSIAPLSHEQHFDQLQDKVVLVNASSKRAEFNLDALKNLGKRAFKRGFGTEFVIDDGRTIRVAADGFPINFFNSESVPSYDIQPVLGMLFVAACRLVERSPLKPGIVELDQVDQNMVESLHERLRK